MGFRNPAKKNTLLSDTAKLLASGATALKEELQRNSDWCKCILAPLQNKWAKDSSSSDFLDQFVQVIAFGIFLVKNNSTQAVLWAKFKTLMPHYFPIFDDFVPALDAAFETGQLHESALDLFFQAKNNSPLLSETNEYALLYLYENFLKFYNPSVRREIGVYYTPLEIVGFIVRALRELLLSEFRISGLSDQRVRVLDFAAGTGIFLLEAYKSVLQEFPKETPNTQLVKNHLLPHFIGHEPYLAPNVVAQLNLVNLLREQFDDFNFKDLYQNPILFHSTIDDLVDTRKISPHISPKNEVLIIIGNPPYSADSQNNSPGIRMLLAPYKKGLEEKNLKPLNDDYIKFIRSAEWRIETAGQGIIGIITNNSFLDGLVHRGMRASLMTTFDRLYLLNLHGHRRQDGDESVFDIDKVGVVIIIGCKLRSPPEQKDIFFFSSLSEGLTTRDVKLDFLQKNSLESITWTRLHPEPPNYWFMPNISHSDATYSSGWSLDTIFNVYTSGIETGNDLFFTAFDYEKTTLCSRINDALSASEVAEVRKKYHWIGTKNRTLEKLRVHGKIDRISSNLIRLHYRPLDIRWCYYERGAMSRDRYDVMQYFLIPEDGNLGIISVRQVGGQESFSHVLVTDKIPDNRIMKSTKGKAYVFPLYVREREEMRPNFSNAFLMFLKSELGYIPENSDIFGYIYAILNASCYRSRFKDFLQKGFPRIPFGASAKCFLEVAAVGNCLIKTHLLQDLCFTSPKIPLYGEGSRLIEGRRIRYETKSQRLYINEVQYWDGVPAIAWHTVIGGWSVLDHWLHERNHQYLSPSEAKNFETLVGALVHSDELTTKIDSLVTFE